MDKTEVVKDGLVAVIAVILAGLLVWLGQYLWNTLCPKLFGLPEITYWQMFGLSMLARLVLGTNEYSKRK